MNLSLDHFTDMQSSLLMDLLTEITYLPLLLFAVGVATMVAAIVVLRRTSGCPVGQTLDMQIWMSNRRLGRVLAGVLAIATVGALYASWQALEYLMIYVFNPGG